MFLNIVVGNGLSFNVVSLNFSVCLFSPTDALFFEKRFHIRRKENPIHFDVNRYHKSIVLMDS